MSKFLVNIPFIDILSFIIRPDLVLSLSTDNNRVISFKITSYYSILNLIVYVFEGSLSNNSRVRNPDNFKKLYYILKRVKQEKKETNKRRKSIV